MLWKYKIILINFIVIVFLFCMGFKKFAFIQSNNTNMNWDTIRFPSGSIFMNKTLAYVNDSNLVVEGNHTTIVFTNFMSHLYVKNCHNIIFKNIQITYNPIPHSEGEITAINHNTITIQQTEGMPFDSSIYDKSNVVYGLFRTANGDLVRNIYNTYMLNKKPSESIGGHIYQQTFNRLPPFITKGMLFIKDPSGIPNTSATINIILSDNITIDSITVYASPSVALGSLTSSNIIINHFKVIPYPNFFLSSNRDGINISNAASSYNKGPFITNSTILDCGDDGINVRNIQLFPLLFGGDTIVLNRSYCKYMSRMVGNIGDTFALYDHSGLIVNTPIPIILKSYMERGDHATMMLRFNQHIGALLTSNGFLVNISQSSDSDSWYALNDNLIAHCRRVGALVLTSKSNIYNNIIEKNASVGLYVSNKNIYHGDQHNRRSLSAPCMLHYSNNTFSQNNCQLDRNLNMHINEYINLQCLSF